MAPSGLKAPAPQALLPQEFVVQSVLQVQVLLATALAATEFARVGFVLTDPARSPSSRWQAALSAPNCLEYSHDGRDGSELT
jgi:hypothetical protein